MRRIRSHLTYANVMSTIAAFRVLAGGTALAASKIGTKDLENGAVTTKKLHKNAVTTKKIKSGAVNSARIADGQLRAADLGPIIDVDQTIDAPNNSDTGLVTPCPKGTRIISGGVFPSLQSMSVSLEQRQGNGWRGDTFNKTGLNGSITVHAYCLKQ
jgi:hypothetical protein